MSKRVAAYGMLVALAFLLSYVETLIPFSFVVPGIKLGLANLVTVIALYCLEEKSALAVSMVRIFLVGFTFTNLSIMVYSLAGGLLSYICMVIARRVSRLSVVGVSVIGGVTHNLGQILLAVVIVKNSALLYYFPFLLGAGTAAGLMIGLLAGFVTVRVKPYLSLYERQER